MNILPPVAGGDDGSECGVSAIGPINTYVFRNGVFEMMENLSTFALVTVMASAIGGAGVGLGKMFIGFGRMRELIYNGQSRLIRAQRGDPEPPESPVDRIIQ